MEEAFREVKEDVMSEVVYTNERLEEKLAYWQKRLRLSDWIIKIDIARQKEFSASDRIGEIAYNVYTKTAHIKILDPVDYDDWDKQDMERTLVHELVHLHFAEICYHFGKDNEFYNVFEEQAIEGITNAIISAERKECDPVSRSHIET